MYVIETRKNQINNRYGTLQETFADTLNPEPEALNPSPEA